MVWFGIQMKLIETEWFFFYLSSSLLLYDTLSDIAIIWEKKILNFQLSLNFI